jgi:hypothetical protein
MLATLQKNVDEKYWWKMLTKKYWQHFWKYWLKILKTVQNIINKKSQSAWCFWDLNLLSGLFWTSWTSIVRLLIQLQEAAR